MYFVLCSVGMRIQYYVILLKCFWVFFIGIYELEIKLFLLEQKENEGKFLDEIVFFGIFMKSFEIKFEKEFVEMEVVIFMF